jgi:hypothetical protein
MLSFVVRSRKRLTYVDNAYVERKRLAGKISDIANIVAHVQYRDNPMEYSRPYSGPSHKLGVNSHVINLDNVVDCVVKEGDEACNANNGQGLTCQYAKDHGSKGRGEEGLIDAVKLSCASVHVERVSDGREETEYISLTAQENKLCKRTKISNPLLDKVHANHAHYCPVCDCIRNVAPIIPQPSPDIVIHASAGLQQSPLSPASLIGIGVGKLAFERRLIWCGFTLVCGA